MKKLIAKWGESAKTMVPVRFISESIGITSNINDIAKVPIIDKAWVRKHFLEFNGAYRLNTGGSSGEPTAFWGDRDCWARE